MITGNFETRQIFINGKELSSSRSLKIRNHSPDGFSWGYSGSGPAQLALAILLNFCYRDFAEDYYQKFKFDIVSALPRSDFELDILKVKNWILEHGGKLKK